MNSGQNTWMLGGLFALVLLAGGGLFLAGVFDGDDGGGGAYAPVEVPQIPEAGGQEPDGEQGGVPHDALGVERPAEAAATS
jgi:hypothetical protein